MRLDNNDEKGKNMAGDLKRFVREELDNQRRYSSNINAIIKKYENIGEDEDIIDISTLSVIKDRGFLRHMKVKDVGSCRLQTYKLKEETEAARCGSALSYYEPHNRHTSRGYDKQHLNYSPSSAGDGNRSASHKADRSLTDSEEDIDEVDGDILALQDIGSFVSSFIAPNELEPSDAETLSSHPSDYLSQDSDANNADTADSVTLSDGEDTEESQEDLGQDGKDDREYRIKELFRDKTVRQHNGILSALKDYDQRYSMPSSNKTYTISEGSFTVASTVEDVLQLNGTTEFRHYGEDVMDTSLEQKTSNYYQKTCHGQQINDMEASTGNLQFNRTYSVHDSSEEDVKDHQPKCEKLSVETLEKFNKSLHNTSTVELSFPNLSFPFNHDISQMQDLNMCQPGTPTHERISSWLTDIESSDVKHTYSELGRSLEEENLTSRNIKPNFISPRKRKMLRFNNSYDPNLSKPPSERFKKASEDGCPGKSIARMTLSAVAKPKPVLNTKVLSNMKFKQLDRLIKSPSSNFATFVSPEICADVMDEGLYEDEDQDESMGEEIETGSSSSFQCKGRKQYVEREKCTNCGMVDRYPDNVKDSYSSNDRKLVGSKQDRTFVDSSQGSERCVEKTYTLCNSGNCGSQRCLDLKKENLKSYNCIERSNHSPPKERRYTKNYTASNRNCLGAEEPEQQYANRNSSVVPKTVDLKNPYLESGHGILQNRLPTSRTEEQQMRYSKTSNRCCKDNPAASSFSGDLTRSFASRNESSHFENRQDARYNHSELPEFRPDGGREVKFIGENRKDVNEGRYSPNETYVVSPRKGRVVDHLFREHENRNDRKCAKAHQPECHDNQDEFSQKQMAGISVQNDLKASARHRLKSFMYLNEEDPQMLYKMASNKSISGGDTGYFSSKDVSFKTESFGQSSSNHMVGQSPQMCTNFREGYPSFQLASRHNGTEKKRIEECEDSNSQSQQNLRGNGGKLLTGPEKNCLRARGQKLESCPFSTYSQRPVSSVPENARGNNSKPRIELNNADERSCEEQFRSTRRRGDKLLSVNQVSDSPRIHRCPSNQALLPQKLYQRSPLTKENLTKHNSTDGFARLESYEKLSDSESENSRELSRSEQRTCPNTSTSVHFKNKEFVEKGNNCIVKKKEDNSKCRLSFSRPNDSLSKTPTSQRRFLEKNRSKFPEHNSCDRTFNSESRNNSSSLNGDNTRDGCKERITDAGLTENLSATPTSKRRFLERNRSESSERKNPLDVFDFSKHGDSPSTSLSKLKLRNTPEVGLKKSLSDGVFRMPAPRVSTRSGQSNDLKSGTQTNKLGQLQSENRSKKSLFPSSNRGGNFGFSRGGNYAQSTPIRPGFQPDLNDTLSTIYGAEETLSNRKFDPCSTPIRQGFTPDWNETLSTIYGDQGTFVQQTKAIQEEVVLIMDD